MKKVLSQHLAKDEGKGAQQVLERASCLQNEICPVPGTSLIPLIPESRVSAQYQTDAIYQTWGSCAVACGYWTSINKKLKVRNKPKWCKKLPQESVRAQQPSWWAQAETIALADVAQQNYMQNWPPLALGEVSTWIWTTRLRPGLSSSSPSSFVYRVPYPEIKRRQSPGPRPHPSPTGHWKWLHLCEESGHFYCPLDGVIKYLTCGSSLEQLCRYHGTWRRTRYSGSGIHQKTKVTASVLGSA